MNKNKYNLPTSHAYSVLGVEELTQSGKIVEKLVHIRNPWGFESYTGPWSDNDSRWTAEFKAQVPYKNGNDGGFFMTFDDFRQIWSWFVVTYVHDDFNLSFNEKIGASNS